MVHPIPSGPRPGEGQSVGRVAGRDVGPSAYSAGVVYFEGADDLVRCLESIESQTHPPSLVLVVDHSGDPESAVGLRERYDQVEWIVARNGGYAAGANRVISRTRELRPDVGFVLILNPDVELERDFCRILIEEVSGRPEVALASGRLLRPGGALIDSAGIERSRTRRFHDRGSGEPDDGRYRRIETVFAVSGAAMMLRYESLAHLAIEGEVFDEDFFVYHEDTDLAWRARLFGFSCLYVPEAVAVHVRKWRRADRARIGEHVRRHSFKNRYLEMVKNERSRELLRDVPFIVCAEVVRFSFAVLVDRSLLRGYWDALLHLRRAWKKRKIIHSRVRRYSGHDPKRIDRDGTGPISEAKRTDGSPG
ncbi:MAG TPA: glycosyltransferase family 2 protein [Deltaproteobacteria bacterium]|nr:glycosyltransferase family 2 protein [Deltaproteobacteria bacterium]